MTSRNFISNNPIETNGTPTDGVSKWLDDFSHSAIPVMCHSHNDYTRPYPLFSALAAGCASVEADVWSTPDGKDLLVGHSKGSLSTERTLQSLYINPLLEILDSLNPSDTGYNLSKTDQAMGVFRTHAYKTLILFIDVKDDPVTTWPLVVKQLEPLRQKFYLSRHQIISSEDDAPIPQTFWLGPITVVGTGNILDHRQVNYGSDVNSWRQYHDVFLDAPLDKLPLAETIGNEQDRVTTTINAWSENEFYTASVSFWKTIGSVRTGLSKSQLSKLRAQITAAQLKGLVTRYWGLPEWPISHRDYVWKILIREGIDLLNADDIETAAKRDWSRGYSRETIWISVVSAYIVVASALLLWFGHRTIQRELRNLEKSNSIHFG